MSMEYIRDRYGVPAKRGARVVADGKPGTIVAARGGHLRIRLDGERDTRSWHPLWHMDYGDGIDHGAAYDARVEAFNKALADGSLPSRERRPPVTREEALRSAQTASRLEASEHPEEGNDA